MRLIVAVHILAGSLALVFGFLALFARKGGTIHRKSGLLFVGAMGLMLFLAVPIGIDRGKDIGLGVAFVAYLMITAVASVRDPVPGSRWRQGAGAAFALAACALYLAAGLEAVALGGARDGVFAPVLFIFALVALLAAVGDWRVIRNGPLTGGRRLARHLWRMCYSFYVATGSFFLGQADELPEMLRLWPLLFLLAFLPLLAMAYWLWRVRRRSLSGAIFRLAADAA